MVLKNKDAAPKPHTIAYACQKLGVSKPSIYDLIRAGKLRTYKVGDRGRRVSDEAINDCIKLLEAEAKKELWDFVSSMVLAQPAQ